MSRLPVLLAISLVGTALSVPAHAQTNIATLAVMMDDWLSPVARNPSARAVAMGGAFLGVADDVSTVFSNPAGLRLLTAPEAFGAFPNGHIERAFPSRGHLFGSPSGNGVDIVPGLETVSHREDFAWRPVFAAYVYPWSRVALGGFFHHHHETRHAFPSTEGLFVTDDAGGIVRIAPTHGAATRQLGAIGGSFAASVTRQLAVGFNVAYEYGDLSISELGEALPGTFSPAGSPLPPFGLPEVPGEFKSLKIRTHRLSYRIGAIWTPTRLVQVGFVYHRAPTADYGLSTDDEGPVADEVLTPGTRTGSFTLPDRAGGGIAVRVTDQGRVSLDIVRVRYSRLSEQFEDAYSLSPADSQAGLYSYPDVTEIHIGAEYAIVLGNTSIVLRGGWWRDPAHSLAYSGTDRLAIARLPTAVGDVNHLTGGAGVVIARYFELDFGVDTTSAARTAVVTALFRF
jgi:long-subunit fatty acid transport protein